MEIVPSPHSTSFWGWFQSEIKIKRLMNLHDLNQPKYSKASDNYIYISLIPHVMNKIYNKMSKSLSL